MKKIFEYLFWTLQIIAFIIELYYIINTWGIPGIGIGTLFAPITALVLPFYMYFVSGIWLPLIITIFGWGCIAISSFFKIKPKY